MINVSHNQLLCDVDQPAPRLPVKPEWSVVKRDRHRERGLVSDVAGVAPGELECRHQLGCHANGSHSKCNLYT